MSVEEFDAGWEMTITVQASATGFVDHEKEAFHNVVLHAYAEDWTPICSKRLGDFPDLAPRKTKRVTVECSAFPYHITFDARESPCDPNTAIWVISYQGEFDNVGRHWSETRKRACGEGLPPTETG